MASVLGQPAQLVQQGCRCRVSGHISKKATALLDYASIAPATTGRPLATMSRLGNRIRQARRHAGVSQSALAQLVGVARSAVAQ